jgi:hypothetical protein
MQGPGIAVIEAAHLARIELNLPDSEARELRRPKNKA